MNSERIREIQQETAYPESISVQQALLKVWNETQQEQLLIGAVMPSLPLAIEVVEKYLNENFWFDHIYENGYPTKVIAKADFLGMLNELKTKLANGNGA